MSFHNKSNDKSNDINLKILILGDSSVGKTTLLLKYVDGYFPTIYVATIGVEFKIKKINVNGIDINLQIWETAGQERFRGVTKNFLKGADGIIYAYDITKKSTFDNLKNWILQAEETTCGFKKIIIGKKNLVLNQKLINIIFLFIEKMKLNLIMNQIIFLMIIKMKKIIQKMNVSKIMINE